jgi:hypothetical protein
MKTASTPSARFDRIARSLARAETRRDVLRRFGIAFAVAGFAVVGGRAPSVDAETKTADHGSRDQMNRACIASGGVFSADGLGNLECHWKSGDWEECDAQGNDCW